MNHYKSPVGNTIIKIERHPAGDSLVQEVVHDGVITRELDAEKRYIKPHQVQTFVDTLLEEGWINIKSIDYLDK